MIQQLRKQFFATLLIPFLLACTNTVPLQEIAEKRHLKHENLSAGQFEILLVANDKTNNIIDLRIYFGSDGIPWEKSRPASDPTGTQRLAVALMLSDPQPSMYLGRPCYHLASMPEQCEPSLWTSDRYSETIISAMSDAVKTLIKRFEPKHITLVGYSGGGAIAVLVAKNLTLETTVITIASNLDIDEWTKYHALLPLSGSANPLDTQLPSGRIRQVHLIGSKDRVVPQKTVQHYTEAHPEAEYYYFDKFDHRCCWAQHWPEIPGRLNPGPPKNATR
jgi:predicted esterase